MQLSDEQQRKCWNDCYCSLNRALNKGIEWNEALAVLVKHFHSKKSGATAPNIAIFDFCMEICKKILL
jgi:hypothetical protein